jgi:uncharacterized protein
VIEFMARHAVGERVRGEALVAKDGFSARYDLDRIRGTFSRPSHSLAGQSYVGKVLVLDTAKGGVPLALVLNSVNPIIAQGAVFGGVTLLAGFDEDITSKVPSGALVELDPASRKLRVLNSVRRT